MTIKSRSLKAVAASALLASALLVAPSAKAGSLVQDTQRQLTALGYYHGTADGLAGPATRTALMNFERDRGLPVTGQISTYSLSHLNAALANPYYRVSYNAAYPYDAYRAGYVPQFVGYNTALGWAMPLSAQSTVIPNRYYEVRLDEALQGGIRQYALNINGRPVLFKGNTPSVVRVSDTFQLEHEDVVIMTVWDGSATCTAQYYMMALRQDGTFVPPTPVGNCADSYNAQVSNGALFVSFPDEKGNWSHTDRWRYQDRSLKRL
jgi:peptidoglycan hydrolase-like protein with peptidoglycan-binding domain